MAKYPAEHLLKAHFEQQGASGKFEELSIDKEVRKLSPLWINSYAAKSLS